MKKIIIALLILSSFVFNGCDSADARNYANEMVGILKAYKTEINKKIKAEQESYTDLAGTYAYAKQMNIQLGLQSERLRRISELTDKLLSKENGGEITSSDLNNMILEYATSDFEQTRQMLEREADEQAQFLTSLEALELQAQNIDALIKVFEELAKPKSDLKKLKELATFAQEFKQKMTELECEDLQRKITCLKEKLEKLKEQNETAKMEILQTEIDRMDKQVKENGCADKTLECSDKP